MSESPCRTFWDIKSTWNLEKYKKRTAMAKEFPTYLTERRKPREQRHRTKERERKKDDFKVHTNSARSNLKTVFFSNRKFMTLASALSLFLARHIFCCCLFLYCCRGYEALCLLSF